MFFWEYYEIFTNLGIYEHLRWLLLSFVTLFAKSTIVDQLRKGFDRPIIANVVSRKSRSAVKKNRIVKLYFEIDMIGQLYSPVTLTM